MALKDIYTMVKADRYTQDGREVLIKAQEAETEDARQPKGIYHWKSGDYRKEGDKYVKIGPGTGGAGPLNPAKKKAARAEIDLKKELWSDIKKREGALHAKGKWRNLEDDPEYAQLMKQYREMDEAESKPEPGPDRDDSPERQEYERQLSAQQAQRAADDPRGYGYEEPPMEPAAESKPDPMQEMRSTNTPIRTAAKIIERGDLDEAITNSMGDIESIQDIARDLLSPAFDAIGEDIPNNYLQHAVDYIQRRYKGLEQRAISGDKAPRVLTGDTRIRVRKA